MPQLTAEENRKRRIDWYNWRKDIPASRAKIQRFKEKMKYRGRDTDDYIQESLKRWHGIDLSDGGVHAILERAAVLFGLSYEAIRQALCNGKVVQADETGWRVEGAEHGICGVHFLRHTHDDLAEAENTSEEAKAFHKQMVWFFRRARKKKKRCTNDEEHLALHRSMQRALERYWKDVTYKDPIVEATRRWWLENRGDQLLGNSSLETLDPSSSMQRPRASHTSPSSHVLMRSHVPPKQEF